MGNKPSYLYIEQSDDFIIYKDPNSISHVKVDPSVKVIGQFRFRNCEKLIQVELPEHGLLEHIDAWAFSECTSLQRITIPSTVKVIGERAFYECKQLRNVTLREGLEQIEDDAFCGCTSLRHITIPSTVKVIGARTFVDCTQLRNVVICEGLERIEEWAFFGCTSLQRITIPFTVKEIGMRAFYCCEQLRNVVICEGLERIEELAFHRCTSLRRITIPSTVKMISGSAFKCCNSLETIEFCEEIEHFVNEVSLPWWNHGVSEASLRTYTFLARRNIPARLGLIKNRSWKNNIQNMLKGIPTMIVSMEEEEESNEDGVGPRNNDDPQKEKSEYFDSINFQLSKHEYMQGVAPFFGACPVEGKDYGTTIKWKFHQRRNKGAVSH